MLLCLTQMKQFIVDPFRIVKLLPSGTFKLYFPLNKIHKLFDGHDNTFFSCCFFNCPSAQLSTKLCSLEFFDYSYFATIVKEIRVFLKL